jgi:hypothetical protein
MSNRIKRTLPTIIFFYTLLFFTQCIGRTDMYVNRQDYETGPLEIFGIISTILFTIYIGYHIIGFLLLALKKHSEDQKVSTKRNADDRKQIKQEKKKDEAEKERLRDHETELYRQAEKQVLEKQIEKYELVPEEKRSRVDQLLLDGLKEKHWREYEAENSWDIYPNSIVGRYIEQSKKLAEELRNIQIKKEDSVHTNLENISWIGNENFWSNNKLFFLGLFSTHYPFNEEQLKKYKNILPFGMEYTSKDERTSFEIVGLIFNRNIVWTDDLQEIYYRPSELIYVGESRDVCSRESDFGRYPITYEDNLEEYRDFEIYRALQCCSSAEEMIKCHEEIDKECESLKEIVDKSYKFGNDELGKILTDRNTLIASYEHFYKQIMSLIEVFNSNFNIENFLDEILMEYESTQIK